VVGIEDPRRGLEHFADPLTGRRRPLGIRHDHPEHAQGLDQHHHVDVEADELTDGHVAIEHEVAAIAEHGDEADVGQDLDRRHVAGPDHRCPHRLVEDVVGLCPQFRFLDRLGAEALHDPDS